MADQAAVTFLLEQVAGVAKSYVDLVSGAEKEFERLKDDVEELKAILKDTASISSEDDVARLFRNEIREVVYEVEDAIDSFLAKHKPAVNKTNFAKKVRSLREDRVKDVLEKARTMRLALASEGTSKESHAQERRTVDDPPIRQDHIVSLKDEEEKIIGYLRRDQTELDIIPVIGMPGLGKTTLTWKIYNDEIIRYEFPICIWVHFSPNFKGKDVLIQIMKYFTRNVDELYSKSERELCNAVHTCLSPDKFLLVVDDVRDREHWDTIKAALPYSNARGKVMITSREMRVGRHVQHITEPHLLRALSPGECWELLQLEVFGKLGVWPEPLQRIGNAIAVKCRGIPMTIVVLGGVLKGQYLSLKSDFQLVKEKWYEVAESENLALEDKKKVIVDVVRLSYDRLPECLRDCFLYLGAFPAGYEVQTWTLMRLWIAEGFIQPDGKRSLEKIAEDYLNDLISRNLLMVQKMNPMGEVKVCRVHDVIRMFCVDEAEKQNLFKEVRVSEGDNADLAASQMEKIPRLCVHSHLDKFFDKKLRSPRLRSFLCFRNDPISLDANNVLAICENFESLRILHTKSIKFKGFHRKLITLNQLRYIVLCVPELDTLPESISLLLNLQTFVVDTNSESIKMKANIWKMIRLRHVKTKAAIVLNKMWEGETGDNLQTLNRLSPESVEAASQRARCLKTLGVRGNLATLFNCMPSENLNYLEKLKLYQAAASNSRLQRLPNLDRFAPNLRRLTLSKTFLEWKHMSTLAMIPDLEVLKLKQNAFTGHTWETETFTFRGLQCLLILIADLFLWRASDSTFPCLRHLELKSCEDLIAIPDCVLKSLENLDIDRVQKSIADSAKNFSVQLKIGADLI